MGTLLFNKSFLFLAWACVGGYLLQPGQLISGCSVEENETLSPMSINGQFSFRKGWSFMASSYTQVEILRGSFCSDNQSYSATCEYKDSGMSRRPSFLLHIYSSSVYYILLSRTFLMLSKPWRGDITPPFVAKNSTIAHLCSYGFFFFD